MSFYCALLMGLGVIFAKILFCAIPNQYGRLILHQQDHYDK
tara:strand:- start:393 stop:515 length:123 start_codon:yes stop_codon:yes gene_type:complete